MNDDNAKAAAQLRKLGRWVRAGWVKLRPVSEKHLAAVRAAVRQDWEQEHAGKAGTKASQSATQATDGRQEAAHAARSTKPKRQSRSKDHGHSH